MFNCGFNAEQNCERLFYVLEIFGKLTLPGFQTLEGLVSLIANSFPQRRSR